VTSINDMHAIAALWRTVFGLLTEIRKHRDAMHNATNKAERDAAQIAYRTATDQAMDALLALQDIGATTVIPGGTHGGGDNRH